MRTYDVVVEGLAGIDLEIWFDPEYPDLVNLEITNPRTHENTWLKGNFNLEQLQEITHHLNIIQANMSITVNEDRR